MFIELHYQGQLYSINVLKIFRFFAQGDNTHVVFDSTTGYSGMVFDENYGIVKDRINEVGLL